MPKRPKKLNIPAIKGSVMLIVGAVIAAAGAVSGLGTQVAAAPAIVFLLGFTEERTAGTASVFGLFAAAAGAVGAGWAGVHIDPTLAILLAVNAFAGALVSSRLAATPKLLVGRRIAQTLTMLLAVYVISAAMRGGAAGPESLHEPFLRSQFGIALIGFVVGVLSTVFQVATGALLVPALLFLVGKLPGETITTSLCVVALASLLPALVHTSQQRVDAAMGPWMFVGGAVGGLSGGALLGYLVHTGSPIPLIVFALIAMFLSAWIAWKLS